MIVITCLSVIPFIANAQKTILTVKGVELTVSEASNVFVNGSLFVTSSDGADPTQGEILNSGKIFITDSIYNKTLKLFYKTSNPFLTNPAGTITGPGTSEGDAYFIGTNVPQTINSFTPKSIMFNDVYINNSMGVKLKNSIIALGQVNFNNGRLFLNGNDLFLYYYHPKEFKYDGKLGVETNNFRIWDDTRLFDPRINERSGRVFGRFQDLGTFKSSNIGVATNASSMSGLILVERGNTTLPYAGDGGIRKYFFISDTTGVTADFKVTYLDSTDYENLHIKESDFRIFLEKPDSPVTYYQAENSHVYALNDSVVGNITLEEKKTSLITVADYNCKNPPRVILKPTMNVCVGTPFEIEFDRLDKVVDSEPTFKWEWTKNGISKNRVLNMSQVFRDTLNTEDVVKYTVTVTDARSCFSSSSIHVTSLPVPSSTFEVKTSQCQDSPVKLLATTNITDVDYTWNMSDGSPLKTTTAKDIEHTYNAFGKYNVSLTSTKGGCSSTISKDIIINPLPEVKFDFRNLCGDLSLFGEFTNTTTFPIADNPNAVSTSTWTFGAGETPISQNLPITHGFNSVGIKPVTLEVRSNNNCISAVTKNVVVEKQTVDFSVDNSVICLGDKLVFTNLSTPKSTGTPKYSWDFGDYTTYIGLNSEKVYEKTGTFEVTLSMETGDCIDRVKKSVIVNPKPDAKGINVFPAKICQGESAKLEPMAEVVNSTYRWDVSGKTINETSPTITFDNYGKIDVSLTVTSLGCSSHYKDIIDVKSKPKANFTYRGECFGTPIQFNNTSTVSGATLTYKWNIPDNETTINPKYSFVTNSGSVDVSLIASSNGCSDTITKTVEIYPNPKIPFNSSSISFCGTTGELDATDYSLPGCLYEWEDGNKQAKRIVDQNNKTYTVKATSQKGCWSEKSIKVQLNSVMEIDLPDDTSFCGNGILQTVYSKEYCTWWRPDGTTIPHESVITADQQGVYKLEVNIQNCSVSKLVNVTINPLPIVSLGADINECAGNKVILDAGEGFTTYKWLSGQNSRTIDVRLSGEYIVTVTNSNKCSNTDAIKVNFKPIPEKPFTIDEVSRCKSASIYAGSSSLSYLWQTGETANTIVVNNSGNYWVKVSNSNCSVYDTIKVNILQVDDVDLGPDISICEGSQVVLNAGNHSSNYSYLWNKQVSTSNMYAVTKAGTYLCEIKDNSNGCSSSDEIFVRFNPSPRVDLGMDRSLCGASSLTLDAGNQGSTIQWGSKKGFVSIQQIVNLTEPDKYWVMVMNNYGCIASDTIQIYPTASNVVAQFIAASKIYEGDTVVFKNMSYTEPYTSLWSFGDGVISIEEHPKHIYHYPSTFTATLTVTNGFCSSTLSKPIIVIKDNRVIGENGQRIGEKYIEIISSKLYPNPTTGNFIFEMELSDYSDVVVGIYTLKGELISFEKIKQSLMVNKQYYLSRLTPGIYILKAWVGGKSAAYKIVKTR